MDEGEGAWNMESVKAREGLDGPEEDSMANCFRDEGEVKSVEMYAF